MNLSLDDAIESTPTRIANAKRLFIFVLVISFVLVILSILKFLGSRDKSFMVWTFVSVVAVILLSIMTYYIAIMINNILHQHGIHQPEFVNGVSNILYSATAVWGACFVMLIMTVN